jgi:signal transduction histidine kinase
MSIARRYWFDALLVVVVAFGAVDAARSGTAARWLEIAAVALLFLRRRFPFASLVAVGVVVAVASFADHGFVYRLVPALAGAGAVFLAGMAPDRSRALTGLALAWSVVALAVHNDPGGGVDDAAAIALAITPLWLLGVALRRKYDEAEEARRRARVAVADERARIARELHDVVAHAVSVMTVQASAVRRLLTPEQERERDALLSVERTGREALAEMRRMVGMLRRPDEAADLAPQPSLDQIEKLAARARDAGLAVDVRIEGVPGEVPAGVHLTAYRLVQEGLTNTLKHAHADRAEVLVRYEDGRVEVSVSDDGRGNGHPSADGHGLVGIRERVGAYGGELEAGALPGGGYRLRASLPVTSE